MGACVTGTPDGPELIGSITFCYTEVNLHKFGEQCVEQVSLEGEEADADTISFYERMRMEMNVNFGRNFYIVSEQYLDMERSEEHTSELQSRGHLVCRLLLEKKKIQTTTTNT